MNLNKEGVEFKAWPKIPREQTETVTITEKYDGTNACIVIEAGEIVGIQSRKRKIIPQEGSAAKGADNAGFAAWVLENEEDLLTLGEGYHYGEWVGESIQSNPHKLEGKHFYLFHVGRWRYPAPRPVCCKVVNVIYEGDYYTDCVLDAMDTLAADARSEGYTAEGVITYYHNTRRHTKSTYENSEGKWIKQ